MQRQAKLTVAENDNFEAQTDQHISKPNPVIRQNLLPMCCYNEEVEALGLTQKTCEELGIGFLNYGRSPLRERVIMQIRDARLNKGSTTRKQVVLSHIGLPDQSNDALWVYPGYNTGRDLLGQDRLWLDESTKRQAKEYNTIIITDDPLGLAKTYQYGVRNVVSTLGAVPSNEQIAQAVKLARENEVSSVKFLLRRDACETSDDFIRQGVSFTYFNWVEQFKGKKADIVTIPSAIRSLSDFSETQLLWLQKMALL